MKLLICITLFLSSFLYANNLNKSFDLICRLQEGKELVQRVQREGKIYLKWERLGKEYARAHWNGTERGIALNSSLEWSEGRKIASIVFELFNASCDREYSQLFDRADRREISNTQFVEAIEKLEYQNLYKANALLKKGIGQGLFPQDAFFVIPQRFSDHLDVQKKSGHAKHIGGLY